MDDGQAPGFDQQPHAKPRVTFSLQPVVRVAILGEEHYDSRHMSYRADGELVARFLKWSARECIYTACRGGTTGSGSHIADYTAEDAARIAAWLREQGVDEVRPDGWCE
jgi:hypothetical protein